MGDIGNRMMKYSDVLRRSKWQHMTKRSDVLRRSKGQLIVGITWRGSSIWQVIGGIIRRDIGVTLLGAKTDYLRQHWKSPLPPPPTTQQAMNPSSLSPDWTARFAWKLSRASLPRSG